MRSSRSTAGASGTRRRFARRAVVALAATAAVALAASLGAAFTEGYRNGTA